MAFTRMISLDRCRADGGTFVEHHGHELAVFRWCDPERVAVIDNTCPHAGGNLAAGEVVGGVVTCPWHHWRFNLDSGVCIHSDHARVTRYAAEIRDGAVWVDLQSALG